MTALGIGAFCVWLWRNSQSFPLKASALSCGVLLATPYVYFYDLPLLALPLLFLGRHRAFDRIEFALLGAIFCALAAFAFLPGPFGLLATILTLAIVIRRVA